MKKALLFSGLLLALTASVALAGGVNFVWGTGCYSDGAPLLVKTFACNVNTGTASFTGSFATTNAISDFVGIEVVVDLQSDGSALPAWWELFNAGACRNASLSTSADFTTAPQIGCSDPWFGLAGGGIAAYQDALFPPPPPFPAPAANRARLKVAYAVADPSPLTGGVEYYGFRGTINYLKTTGTPVCAGCATPVTLVLNEIKAAGIFSVPERLVNALNNQCINWQAGGQTPCSATPANNATWGQVKSLYR